MKRMKRNPAKFDAIELYAAIARERDYKINSENDHADFVATIGQSLKASQTDPNLLYGKRVEALFAHVIGAMGRCKIIKQEDSGSIYVIEDAFEVPDYRVVLSDGSSYLIEVKNFHMKSFKSKFTLPKKYMHKLDSYAQANNIPLRIAVYFSNPNVWVLLPKEAFREKEKHYVVDFGDAMARNEMATLGDRTIATLPDLRFEMRGDSDECSVPDANGQVLFTPREIKFYCRDQEVTTVHGKGIAFYLMRYGTWEEVDATPFMSDEKVTGVTFIFRPSNPASEQQFQTIGTLSSMISSAYRDLTVDKGVVEALDVKQDPSFFTLEIPEDFKDPNLPLWQFILQPNYDLDKNSFH